MIFKDGMKIYSSVKTLYNIFDIRTYNFNEIKQIYIANSSDQFMRFDLSGDIGGHYMHINRVRVAKIVGVDEL